MSALVGIGSILGGSAALGSLGASIFGGDGSSNRQSREAMEDAIYRIPKRIKRTVDGARAAGISPLAALGIASGGGVGGTLSRGNVISDAVASAGDALGGAVSSYGRAREAASAAAKGEARAEEAHNAALAESAALTRKYQAEGYASQAYGDSLISRVGQTHVASKVDNPTRDVSQHRQLPGDGWDWTVSPGSPAEDWEREYAEVGSNLYGTGKLIKDFLWNLEHQMYRAGQAKKRFLQRRGYYDIVPPPRRKPGYGAPGKPVTVRIR